MSFDKQSVALCESFNGRIPKHPVVEGKLDGVRGQILIRDGQFVSSVSRNNKPIYNVTLIVHELMELGFDNCVVDGEFWAGSLQRTVSATKSFKSKSPYANDLKLFVFDSVPLSEYDTRDFQTVYDDRLMTMNDILGGRRLRFSHETHDRDIDLVENKKVLMLPMSQRFDNESVWEYAKWLQELVIFASPRLISALVADPNGCFLEGGVLKDLEQPYFHGRQTVWQKVKFRDTIDCKIVDAYLGTGRNSNRLGGFWVETPWGHRVRCGGGLKDSQRNDYWALWTMNPDELRGKTVEVSYLTRTPGGSLREPEFLRIRDDK